jgi:TPR repeat protein
MPNNDALDGAKPQPLSVEEVNQIRQAAEKMRDIFQKELQVELDYDEESLRWLDGYIERIRPRHKESERVIGSIGSFLGECIIRNLGGQWARYDGMSCVAFDDRNAAFPYNKVAKQFANGAEKGDSILGFYQVEQAFHALKKPLTPAQNRLLEFFRKGCRIFVFFSGTKGWEEVEEIDDCWLKLRKKPSVSYVASMSLAQIDCFYVCSSNGQLLHTEWIAESDWETLPAEILEQIKRSIPADTSLTINQLESGKRFVEIEYGESPRKEEEDYRFYSTVLKNISAQKIRITRFGGYIPQGNAWKLANVTGNFYTADDFKDWYHDDFESWSQQEGEWLMPGDAAYNAANWGEPPSLWAYFGVTDTGESFIAGKVLDLDEGMKLLRPQTKYERMETVYRLGVKNYTRQNYEEAEKSFLEAAHGGLAEAQYVLGLLYWDGEGLAQNREEAEKWYRKAANQGHTGAQFRLGALYDDKPGHVHDHALAVWWYQKAAEQGQSEAIASLGTMYYLGHGIEQSNEKAAECFERAAEGGNPWAQDYLGEMYEEGLVVAKDEAKAAHWYGKAAEEGHASAQYHLALLYETGRGVEKNPAEARKWFERAAAKGVHEKQGLILLQKGKSTPGEAGETPMRPFNLITSRDPGLFPWEALMEYEHLMAVDWREEENWIVERFCRASGLSREGINLTWNDAGDLLHLTYPGGSIDIEQGEGRSAQHSMIAALQTAFGATHSIRHLSHLEGSDTVYFVVETHTDWQDLEARNLHVRWFFTPIERIPDVFLSDYAALDEAAERYFHQQA